MEASTGGEPEMSRRQCWGPEMSPVESVSSSSIDEENVPAAQAFGHISISEEDAKLVSNKRISTEDVLIAQPVSDNSNGEADNSEAIANKNLSCVNIETSQPESSTTASLADLLIAQPNSNNNPSCLDISTPQPTSDNATSHADISATDLISTNTTSQADVLMVQPVSNNNQSCFDNSTVHLASNDTVNQMGQHESVLVSALDGHWSFGNSANDEDDTGPSCDVNQHASALSCASHDSECEPVPCLEKQEPASSASMLRLKDQILFWNLPEGFDSSEEGTGTSSIGSGSTNRDADSQREVPDFSGTVDLLRDNDGVLFCGQSAVIDDSWATLQISNLMSTILDDIRGHTDSDFELNDTPVDLETLVDASANLRPADYLDVAMDRAVLVREPLVLSSEQSVHIHEMPDEIIHHIFSMFNLTELCRFVPLVCRRWSRLVQDPIHWQYLTVGHLESRLFCSCLERATLLKSLDLGSRNELSIDEAILLSRNCPQLQEINLAFCDTLNNFLLKILADKCTNLQKINLEGCMYVDDDSLSLLSRLPKLTSVNLSHCNFVQTEGVEALATNLIRITELNIDGIPNVADSAMFLLVKHHADHLEKLEVDGAELTDKAIKAFTNLTALVDLKVSFAELLTDVSLYHLKDMKNPLKVLKMKKGCDFSTECLLDLFSSGCLSSLQSLDFSECVQLLDDGVAAMVKCCGKNLRYLSLCWCWNITDQGLDAIVGGCPLLETLQLVGVHKMKGHSLERVPDCMPHLRLLDLQQCNQVIDDLVVEVVRKLPQLVAYNYYGERFQYAHKDVIMIK